MTTLVIILSAVGYVGLAIPVAAYSRNRSFSKHFNFWYIQYNKPEEFNIRAAIKNVEKYDSTDVAIASFFGGVLWPIFVICYLIHYLFKVATVKVTKFMPMAQPEKLLASIERNKQLEAEKVESTKQLAKAIKLLKEAGIKEEDINIGGFNTFE